MNGPPGDQSTLSAVSGDPRNKLYLLEISQDYQARRTNANTPYPYPLYRFYVPKDSLFFFMQPQAEIESILPSLGRYCIVLVRVSLVCRDTVTMATL